MVSPHTVHLRNLLNTFNSILEGGTPPLDIFQNQIAEFERNFTTPTQPLTLYIDIPKGDPQAPFSRYTFTLASHHPLTPPGLRLEVDCPLIDLGLSGVILPRGVEFSSYTTSTPPTRRVSFSLQECKGMEGEECKIKPDPILRVSRSVHAKDCKGMDEKECKNNPDICTYRSFKGGKRGCAAKRGTLKPGASTIKQHPLPYASRDLLEEFKPTVLEYLPDLIGTIYDGGIHVLPHNHTLFTYYHHIEVVKRFTITEDTKFSKSLLSIVGGPVNLVGDMSRKFASLTHFNSPVEGWDTSRVTRMHDMFMDATTFNQPLHSWNVSGVTDMYGMFANATTFNQPLQEWNVSKVKNMGSMFFGASAFNQPLNQWNVSGVTNMGSMFDIAATFNQPLEQWNVSGVDNMGSMFQKAATFNQPLGQWNVSGVKDMGGMFTGATFNQPLGQWNVSQVNYMSFMFHGATTFNQPLRGWNVSGVTDMGSMFYGATAFNQLLGMWDPKDVIYMDDMFDMSSMEILPKWYTDFYSGYW